MSRPKARDDASWQERVLLWTDQTDPSGCWIWTGAQDVKGYGRMTIRQERYLAHRASYIAFVGPIPDGMTVDHICFVPACVNPSHLQLLTHSENCARQQAALATHCARGHEFTEANTDRRASKPGRRQCRTCHLERCRLWHERRRAEVAA